MFPNAKVVAETASGAKQRPLLRALLADLKGGDELIIAALDRLGRRALDVLQILEDLHERSILVRSLREGVDYASPTGKLVTQILCSIAELERNVIIERTRAGLTSARAKGRTGGRPRLLDEKKAALARRLHSEKKKTIAEICQMLKISKPTFYDYLKSRHVPQQAVSSKDL